MLAAQQWALRHMVEGHSRKISRTAAAIATNGRALDTMLVASDCDLTPFQKFIFSVKKVRATGLLTDSEKNSPMC